MSASHTCATPVADDVSVAPWRIVIVDDSSDDVELACIELAEAGIEAQCRHVDTEAALVRELRSFAPQLVLSDINIPGFSGERALVLVREHAPDARFVFLSGHAGEVPPGSDGQPAVDGRLSKDHMAGLPALVRGLLDSFGKRSPAPGDAG